jgi:hypothetical protein
MNFLGIFSDHIGPDVLVLLLILAVLASPAIVIVPIVMIDYTKFFSRAGSCCDSRLTMMLAIGTPGA